MADLSTQAAIKSEYLATLDYDLTGDTSKAARYISALRAYLINPSQMGRGPDSIQLDLAQAQKLLEKAESWYGSQIAANGDDTSKAAVVHSDYSCGLDRW